MASATKNSLLPSDPGSRAASRPSPPAIPARTPLYDDQPVCSIPLQRPFLPDVNEADEEDQHEHQHLAEPEERDVSHRTSVSDERHEAGELLVVNRPRNHEDRLDVENDEQNRNEVKTHREAFAGIP